MTSSMVTAMPAFLWTQRREEDAKVAKKKSTLNFFAFFASSLATLASKKMSPKRRGLGNRVPA